MAVKSLLTARPDETINRLEALVDLARSARQDGIEAVLGKVAETVRAVAGFRTVVFNVYRPAWDDYEVVLVVGPQAARDALLGTTEPRTVWHEDLLVPRYEVQPGVFFIPADSGVWDRARNFYVPSLPDPCEPNGWRREDALMVSLRDSSGSPLGVLSVDEPESGLAPTYDDLSLLRAICSHAEQALENARVAEAAAVRRRRMERLLDAARLLSGYTSREDVLLAACDVLVPDLGFEKVASYLRQKNGAMALVAQRNFPPGANIARSLPTRFQSSLLDLGNKPGGCLLEKASSVHGAGEPGHPRSARNGTGLAGWDDHVLLFPIFGTDRSLQAVLAIEDPTDRLVPSEDDQRTIQLLVDQVAVAFDVVSYRDRLRHMANHDALTGVLNRRGLAYYQREPAQSAALLSCDLDHFKLINDTYGHDVGDAVLTHFGDLLTRLSREGDLAVRLGGEEFLLLLAETDVAGAQVLAQRLLEATPRAMAELVQGRVTVSVGITSFEPGAHLPDALREADAALYEAKSQGRNRAVIYRP